MLYLWKPLQKVLCHRIRNLACIALGNDTKNCVFIGNFLFQTVFRLMQPLLGPDVSKVEVFGNNRENWLPALLKAFPKNEMPEYYGGEKGNKPVAVYG